MRRPFLLVRKFAELYVTPFTSGSPSFIWTQRLPGLEPHRCGIRGRFQARRHPGQPRHPERTSLGYGRASHHGAGAVGDCLYPGAIADTTASDNDPAGRAARQIKLAAYDEAHRFVGCPQQRGSIMREIEAVDRCTQRAVMDWSTLTPHIRNPHRYAVGVIRTCQGAGADKPADPVNEQAADVAGTA